MNIKIPNKQYLFDAYSLLLEGDINIMNNSYSYYGLNEKIFTSEKLKKLMEENGIKNRLKLSSGTSDRLTFNKFIQQTITDLQNASYYRFYTPPKGNIIARKALSYMETTKFKNSFYTEDDICITEGSTGAITLVIEYIKNTYLNAEVLIAGPTYYLYKFASTYYNLPIREVITVDKKNPFAFNLKLLKNSISEKTKLIVLVRPNNPVGEIYTAADVSEILLIAKEKNILVLADEIFFELIFNKNTVEECDILAEKTKTLNNLVIVKGYSKNKNLAAFRIGYVLSKNKDLLTAAQEISEQRQCFPNAQNYTGIICLDSFIQATNTLIKKKGLLIEQAISQARKNLSFSPTIKEKTYNELKTIYVNYQKYIQEKMKYYSENLETALTMLQDDLAYMLPKTTAFNTLVKIKGLEGINHFDFCFNLLLTTGTESQIGPCFAFDQQVWQENPNLGFWLRLSYSRETFLEGVKNFVEFKKIYLENQDKFLKTNILLKQGNMIK